MRNRGICYDGDRLYCLFASGYRFAGHSLGCRRPLASFAAAFYSKQAICSRMRLIRRNIVRLLHATLLTKESCSSILYRRREHHLLLELAIGDAYGAGFEYVDTEMIRQQNTLSGYVNHPRHSIQPGCYTDD